LVTSTRRSIYPFGLDWLLFSGPGAVSKLHRDDGSTIAWFAQIQGTKRFVVHSEVDRPYLYAGHVDPMAPNWSEFPDYAQARPVEIVLHPGDLLYLPPNWYHHVVTESPSITVTGNVVNEVNLGDYLRYAYGDRLTEVLALLPEAQPKMSKASP
jgi:oxalate decarboxylase/phosphoglucose isomerase-like protein (cupin superfamily)